MSESARLRQLVEQLLEFELTPEEVCANSMELLPLVRQRLEQLLACDVQVDAMFPAPDSISSHELRTNPQLAGDLPRIPGYTMLGVLGRGGMGIVYKARHLRLNREVALKMLLANEYAVPLYRDRFLQEAEAVAGLKHPNIVQVHDMGDLNGQPYFTMEFVEGGNLAQKLVAEPLPQRDACALLATLAATVQIAHENRIVHRDLKPANVLLTADGTPKISDFGLARRLDDQSQLTWIGTAIGTPSYMAPEQAEAKPYAIGPAVDIYSLGAILYELLTGRPPLTGNSAAETVHLVISRDPSPPSQLNVLVARDLDMICLKCLQKEPHRRYISAAALAADLIHFLNGEAIAARPDGRLMRILRQVRQRPAHAAALVTGALLSITLLGGGLWFFADRAASARKAKQDLVTIEFAAQEDLRDMARWLNRSSWQEARVALERAKGRLGELDSPEIRLSLNQADRDLDLILQLEAIRMNIARAVLGLDFSQSDEQYSALFRQAGLGRIDDDPAAVASRIRGSNIRIFLVAALDDWYGCTRNRQTKDWVAMVARQADPDPAGWRDRARSPAILEDEAALLEILKTAPVAEQCVSLFLALDRQLPQESPERLPFLKRIQYANPSDFWLNLALGEVLLRCSQPPDAIGYYQAAVSVRPQTALSHHLLGYALLSAGRIEEAIRHLRLATKFEPTYVLGHHLLAMALSDLGQYGEAVDRLRSAIQISPDAANLHHDLGRTLEHLYQASESLSEHRQAVALDPSNSSFRRELSLFLVRHDQGEEARTVWRKTLESALPMDANWHDYAEFCLFTGSAEEYCRVRGILLSRLASNADQLLAEKTARTCLLRSGSNAELGQAVAFADHASTSDHSRHAGKNSYGFLKGLSDYRQGKFNTAISKLRLEQSGFLNPARQIVIAMAQHRLGQPAVARKTLSAAILIHDWTAIQVRSQDDWLLHILRREAETLILPNLSALLVGEHKAQDNDERFASIGACQFANQSHALCRLYADAFEADPGAANAVGYIHRRNALRAAVKVGTSDDGDHHLRLSDDERKRWRKQAYDWIQHELAFAAQVLVDESSPHRLIIWDTTTRGLFDPDLTRVREPSFLALLPADEREQWAALWSEVRKLQQRSSSP